MLPGYRSTAPRLARLSLKRCRFLKFYPFPLSSWTDQNEWIRRGMAGVYNRSLADPARGTLLLEEYDALALTAHACRQLVHVDLQSTSAKVATVEGLEMHCGEAGSGEAGSGTLRYVEEKRRKATAWQCSAQCVCAHVCCAVCAVVHPSAALPARRARGTRIY
jgi:hypothetical protein